MSQPDKGASTMTVREVLEECIKQAQEGRAESPVLMALNDEGVVYMGRIVYVTVSTDGRNTLILGGQAE